MNDPGVVLEFLGSREWRNWQTRWLQVPVPARAWGFKSPLAHGRERAGSRHRSGPFRMVHAYRRVTELAWSFMLPSDDALTA